MLFEPQLQTQLLAWLRAHLRGAEPYPANVISSIYYDSLDWLHLFEKRNGDYFKTKFRVRWYDAVDAPSAGRTAYAELKLKTGTRREKLRMPVSITADELERMALSDPRLLSLPSRMAENLGRAFERPLVPSLLVRFRRHRFLCTVSGARVNLDAGITTPRVNPQMIAPELPIPITSIVCEVKGDLDVLPPSLYALTAMGGRVAPFSKCFAAYLSVTGQYVL